MSFLSGNFYWEVQKIFKEKNIKLLFSDYVILFTENKQNQEINYDPIFGHKSNFFTWHQDPIQFYMLHVLSCFFIFFWSKAVLNFFLIFHTLTLLKIIHQLFYRISINLGVSNIPHIRVMLCIFGWNISGIIVVFLLHAHPVRCIYLFSLSHY